MKRRIGVLFFLLLAACGGETPDAPEAAVDETSPDPRAPVVVYASYEDGNYLPQLFQAFTEETGIRVNVRSREQSINVGDVIANRGSPPADILIVNGVHDLWRAADEGALRPLAIEDLDSLVDPRFRDPDGQWVATSISAAMIVYNTSHYSSDDLPDYEGLADERHRGALCIGSSQFPTNRALMAMLIDRLGVRPAEIVVRGWIRNLALPPFPDEIGLLAAIDNGTCKIGIVSSPRAYNRYVSQADMPSHMHLPDPAYGNIEGIAIARHAHEPEAAKRLIEWLLSEQQQREHSRATMTMPANRAASPEGMVLRHIDSLADREVSVAGWRDEEAILLAERARYR